MKNRNFFNQNGIHSSDDKIASDLLRSALAGFAYAYYYAYSYLYAKKTCESRISISFN